VHFKQYTLIRLPVPSVIAPFRLARPVGAVHITIAKTSTITEKIAVHLTVITVLDTADFPITLPRADVAAHRALVADTGRKQHVPLTHIAFGMGLIGKYPGGADFTEVPGKRAFQNALLVAPEIQIIIGSEYPQILAAGVIVIKPDTAITVDAAVHLMGQERPQVLVTVCA